MTLDLLEDLFFWCLIINTGIYALSQLLRLLCAVFYINFMQKCLT